MFWSQKKYHRYAFQPWFRCRKFRRAIGSSLRSARSFLPLLALFCQAQWRGVRRRSCAGVQSPIVGPPVLSGAGKGRVVALAFYGGRPTCSILAFGLGRGIKEQLVCRVIVRSEFKSSTFDCPRSDEDISKGALFDLEESEREAASEEDSKSNGRGRRRRGSPRKGERTSQEEGPRALVPLVGLGGYCG